MRKKISYLTLITRIFGDGFILALNGLIYCHIDIKNILSEVLFLLVVGMRAKNIA
jgi:hypothetical protein